MKRTGTLLAASILFAFAISTNAQVGINSTGNTPDSSAMLDVTALNKGLLIPRMTTTNRIMISSAAKGLILYDSTSMSFWFYNGTAWNELLYEKLWSRNTSNFFTYLQNMNDRIGIGTATPGYTLHISDQITSNNDPLLFIEKMGSGDASAAFFKNQTQCFTVGFDNSHNYFKISDTSVLIGDSYVGKHNMLTMSNINRGVVHFNHQSRARAFLTGMIIPPVGQGQIIPMGIWTTIGFDFINYDEQSEFFLAPSSPPYPANAGSFTPKEEGYYQINARTEFNTDPPDNTTNSYVRIAIYVNGVPRSYGNSLNWYDSNSDKSYGNNGPVVSDILHLNFTDVVTIRVWQNINGSSCVALGGQAVTYVSIHKLS